MLLWVEVFVRANFVELTFPAFHAFQFAVLRIQIASLHFHAFPAVLARKTFLCWHPEI